MLTHGDIETGGGRMECNGICNCKCVAFVDHFHGMNWVQFKRVDRYTC